MPSRVEAQPGRRVASMADEYGAVAGVWYRETILLADIGVVRSVRSALSASGGDRRPQGSQGRVMRKERPRVQGGRIVGSASPSGTGTDYDGRRCKCGKVKVRSCASVLRELIP